METSEFLFFSPSYKPGIKCMRNLLSGQISKWRILPWKEILPIRDTNNLRTLEYLLGRENVVIILFFKFVSALEGGSEIICIMSMWRRVNY